MFTDGNKELACDDAVVAGIKRLPRGRGTGDRRIEAAVVQVRRASSGVIQIRREFAVEKNSVTDLDSTTFSAHRATQRRFL